MVIIKLIIMAQSSSNSITELAVTEMIKQREQKQEVSDSK